MNAKEFGDFLAAVRKEKTMTQAELAKIIHVTDKAISRWERGMGFPDIRTLEPLAKALDISVLELMRSQRLDMENRNLMESEVVEIMSSAVEMNKENQRQDKDSFWLGGIVTIVIALLVMWQGYASVGGALFIGAVASIAAISIYFFIKNKEDKSSRKIYGFFMMVGVGLSLGAFQMLGVDANALVRGLYGIFFIVVCLFSK